MKSFTQALMYNSEVFSVRKSAGVEESRKIADGPR